jgi:UDP-glucose 6-dehydrogenase
MKILIYGKGKVGQATATVFMEHNPSVEIGWVDPHKQVTVYDVSSYDAAIVCVPSLENGPYDHSALDQTLLHLHEHKFKGIIAIRSTVTPDWFIRASDIFDHLKIIHFPEFMKQHGDHVNDNPWIVVLGGKKEYTTSFAQILTECGYGNPENYELVDGPSSTIIKLGQNGFLATKVTYFNVIYGICQKYGVDYDIVRKSITIDDRINDKHTDVPGWDGKLGFGGHCLPKDISALARLTKDPDVLASVISYNTRVRNENIQNQ